MSGGEPASSVPPTLPGAATCLGLSGHPPLSRELAVPSARGRKVKLKLLLLPQWTSHVFLFFIYSILLCLVSTHLPPLPGHTPSGWAGCQLYSGSEELYYLFLKETPLEMALMLEFLGQWKNHLEKVLHLCPFGTTAQAGKGQTSEQRLSDFHMLKLLSRRKRLLGWGLWWHICPASISLVHRTQVKIYPKIFPDRQQIPGLTGLPA